MGLVEQEGLGAPLTSADVVANVVVALAGELENLVLDDPLPAAAVADRVADDDDDDDDDDGESDGDDNDGDDDGEEDDDNEDDEEEEHGDGQEEDGGGAGSCEGEKVKKEEENDKKKKKKRKNKKKKGKGNQKGADEGGSTDGSVFLFPQKPNEPDCAYYMKRGICKYGMNCRFNHPPERTRHQQVQVAKGNEGLPERVGQPECKFYLKTGTCKFGGACRYHHPREKDGAGGKPELNFLGLPIRLGEKECPFYMRTGSCKYATNCKFHHPDPTAIGACPPASGYHQGGGSFPVHPAGTSQAPASSWSVQMTSNDLGVSVEASPPFMPVMLPPHPAVLPIPGWNGYPAPVAPLLSPEWHQQPPSAPTVNDQSARKADFPMNQPHEPLDDFPERPGQPECQYFLKTGNCKFKGACKFHHPRSRVSKPLVCALSPMGLPLRPDQTVCLHYSRYGICKFGPACKFDHPLTYAYQSPLAATIDGQCQPIEPSSYLEGGRSFPHALTFSASSSKHY
ncbi:Zinc finger CCCH domain-containing protein 67 [Nymphaea thermarum]|nr:Zinc finger CCCH domain-containing protein 67 [Nymphaea thermarum]